MLSSTTANGDAIIAKAKQALDLDGYLEQNWTGSFAQYLDIVRRNPKVTRSAFERIYEMILSFGTRAMTIASAFSYALFESCE